MKKQVAEKILTEVIQLHRRLDRTEALLDSLRADARCLNVKVDKLIEKVDTFNRRIDLTLDSKPADPAELTHH
jgi:hypothetical protein